MYGLHGNKHGHQYFQSVEQLYKERLGAFISLAGSYLNNPDYAIDAVHDAIAKTLIYFQKHPEKKVRETQVNWIIIRICKKFNKRYAPEIAVGLLNQDR